MSETVIVVIEVNQQNVLPFVNISLQNDSVRQVIICDFILQESRINDQRCDPDLIQQAPTVPDEDFFGLILRLQSNRIDEQRCSLPDNKRENNGAKSNGAKPQYRKESQL